MPSYLAILEATSQAHSILYVFIEYCVCGIDTCVTHAPPLSNISVTSLHADLTSSLRPGALYSCI